MKSIKQILLKKIIFGTVISLVIMAVLCFLIQAIFADNSTKETALMRISDAKTRLSESASEIAQITEEMNEEYLAKTRAFAEMIELNPSILESSDKLNQIKDELKVDELHVTDENGLIKWTTIPGYIDFDFKTSEQTKPFLKCLEDKNFELAQEPQLNGAEGILFQYISVGRRDKSGIVQIGMEPKKLSDALKENQINAIFKSITVGKSGTMFAVSKSDKMVAAFYDETLIGKAASEIGLNDGLLSMNENSITRAFVNGKSMLVCVSQTDDYYIGALVPSEESITNALFSTAIIMVIAVAVILLLVFIVMKNVNKNVVNALHSFVSKIDEISNGNDSERVNVRNCAEINALSNGFNALLDGIDEKIHETGQLNVKMQGLIGNVASTSQNINSLSVEMKDVSRRISEGSSQQADTVKQLSDTFHAISNDVRENASAAERASSFSKSAGEQLNVSVEKMNSVKDAMVKITDCSQEIEKIVKTIDDIAFQTNILALNASIEAARAGVAGKGFAVVADEVRNLATKSSEAAQSTNELIAQTLEAVENGNVTAQAAAEELQNMKSDIEKNIELIDAISNASAKQADAVEAAKDGMDNISEIAQRNSAVSATANDTADRLDSAAADLISLVTFENK